MTGTTGPSEAEQEQVARALAHAEVSVRLQAALRAGSAPAKAYVDVLVARCGVEPDFFVRDMLTWALVQHDRGAVVERLLPELRSDVPQARAQALHTVSKLADAHLWPAITRGLLTDADDEVARTAWRAAVVLAPAGEAASLAEMLGTQWARGGRDVRLSLSQALVALGEAARPVIERAARSDDEQVRWHALATQRIAADPDLAFDAALEEARRLHSLRGAPTAGSEPEAPS